MADETSEATFKAPPGTFDTHFHIFGPKEKYPVQHRDRYEAPLALLEDYLRFARRLGIERFVFVQPSAYGTDNSCMLDAMSAFGGETRGLVELGPDVQDSELADLHERGVRGIRINTSPYAKFDSSRAAELIPRIESFGSRLAGSGWCLEFLSPSWLTQALTPMLRKLRIPYILDHIGLFQAGLGVGQPGFREVLELGESGWCWFKLTGAYRISQRPDFADAAPLIHAIASVAPDRLLWGSDFPHLRFEHVSSVALFNLLGEWFPDEAMRRKVLVDNPASLFGYGAVSAVAPWRKAG